MQKGGPDLRIGELLVESGIISTSDLLAALEMSVQGDQRVGETLLDLDWITEDKLNAGLELQKLVTCRVLSKEAAIRALTHMHKTNESLDKCVARETSPETKHQRDISQDEFLRLAGALTGVPVSQLVSVGDRPHVMASERETEDIEVFDAAEEKEITQAAEVLRQAIRDGHLNLDQSMIIMSYCLRGRMKVIEAIKLLGWTVPVKL
jgi:hypothetical protein